MWVNISLAWKLPDRGGHKRSHITPPFIQLFQQKVPQALPLTLHIALSYPFHTQPTFWTEHHGSDHTINQQCQLLPHKRELQQDFAWIQRGCTYFRSRATDIMACAPTKLTALEIRLKKQASFESESEVEAVELSCSLPGVREWQDNVK